MPEQVRQLTSIIWLPSASSHGDDDLHVADPKINLFCQTARNIEKSALSYIGHFDSVKAKWRFFRLCSHLACVFHGKTRTVPWLRCAFKDACVRLAGLGKGLALPVLDIQQPLALSCLRQPDGVALAVVEDVRSLVDHEVREWVLHLEILERNEAGGLLAPAHDLVSVRSRLRWLNSLRATSTCVPKAYRVETSISYIKIVFRLTL